MTEKTASSLCIILAAGKGTRMKSSLPKVMHGIAGRPMLGHVMATAQQALSPQKLVVVLAEGMDAVARYAEQADGTAEIAIQKQQLGTGDAVKSALPALQDFQGIAFVLYGDTPLIQPATLQSMQLALQSQPQAGLAVLGMRPVDPAAYGRLVLNKENELERIVEFKDASPEERKITLCNSGVMAFRAEHLEKWLNQLQNNNANQEYYLTDVVALARKDSLRCLVVEAPEEEMLGVNDRVQLAEAEGIIQQRLRQQAMLNGVTLQDPASIYLSYDTEIGNDVTVEPHVYFGTGVKVASGVTLRAFSHFQDAVIGRDSIIGPYARLRPGANIGEKAHIGNFVEIKQATIEKGAKVNHLSYVGDASIGAHANIGAGTITCNYDGFQKHHTHVGEYAFIGSNTALVAPVAVGDRAIVGAGSVITEDVEADSLSMTRPTQIHRHGWAKQFRLKKKN